MGIVPSGAPGPNNFNTRFGYTGGGADRVEMIGRTQTVVEDLLKADAKPGVDAAFGDFGGGIVNILVKLLTGQGDQILVEALQDVEEFVQGAWDSLGQAWEMLGALVDNLLGALGLPSMGSIVDRIIDLADEIGGWLDDTMDTAADLANLIGKLLSNPIEVLGSIPQALVSGLTGALNSVSSFIQDLVDAILRAIRKVPIVGGTLADIIAHVGGLKDLADNTHAANKDLTNQVWAGASQAVAVSEDKTSEEVRRAVAELKARAEADRAVLELQTRDAVPLWQSLASPADVTIPLSSVAVSNYHVLAVDGRSGNDDSGFVADHTHSAGTYTYQYGEQSESYVPIGVSGSSQTPVLMGAAFRAGSAEPKEVVSFIGSLSTMAGTLSSVQIRAYLLSYDFEEDKWRAVARTENLNSKLSASLAWVDGNFEKSYTPRIGELLAIGWGRTCSLSGDYAGTLKLASGRWNGPDVMSSTVPYGICFQAVGAAVDRSVDFWADGSLYSIPANGNVGGVDGMWTNTAIPFAQIGPNVGQETVIEPRYWYDNFSYALNGNYYSQTGSLTAKVSDGRFKFSGTTDGWQSIVYKTPMATAKHAVEVTAFNPSSRPVMICGGMSASGKFGIRVAITSSGVQMYAPSYGSDGSPVASVSVSTTGTARWALQCNFDLNVFNVLRDGVAVLSWEGSPGASGPDYRCCGAGVSRSSFVNSGELDDLLIYDYV